MAKTAYKRFVKGGGALALCALALCALSLCALSLDWLKKLLDNLSAAWKVFQQHKEAAKALLSEGATPRLINLITH